mgnify:CR=1 FL=1
MNAEKGGNEGDRGQFFWKSGGGGEAAVGQLQVHHRPPGLLPHPAAGAGAVVWPSAAQLPPQRIGSTGGRGLGLGAAAFAVMIPTAVWEKYSMVLLAIAFLIPTLWHTNSVSSAR